MDRRQFIKDSAVTAVGLGIGAKSLASVIPVQQTSIKAEEPAEDGRLIISEPMLQNYAETSMGVAFAVSDMANGYVIYGRKPDLSDGRKVKCGGFRTTDMNDKVMLVRLTGLKPATKYYYRIGADRISYKGGYNMHIIGNEESGNIHSFTTAGPRAKAHFCVLNDTHGHMSTLDLLTAKVASLAPSCVVLNGDATNVQETIESEIDIFLNPDISIKDYASDLPYVFCLGNHDQRGMASRHLEKVWMFRQPEERESKYWDLGRNFAIRMGDIALIGLDTGEDKLDTNPLFAGLFNNEEYRVAQKAWLEDTLKRKDIADAPHIVMICHIPLFDDRPRSNPGDVRPDDKDPEKYDNDFATWQRTCAQLWGPLIEKSGCKLVITAHEHVYRFDAPAEGRSWAQIVGGGPDISDDPNAASFPTVMDVRTKGRKLVVDVHNAATGKVVASHTFEPRK